MVEKFEKRKMLRSKFSKILENKLGREHSQEYSQLTTLTLYITYKIIAII